MSFNDEILYVHARRQGRKVGPGHWFFDTGQWAQCAQAWRVKRGKWRVRPDWAPHGKSLPAAPIELVSVDEVIAYVAEYFGTPVRRASVRDLPDPDAL
jgi:hypothetical protein